MRAFFAVLKDNAVAILRRKGEGRFSALLDPPPVLPLFFPFRGNDSSAAVEHAGIVAAPVGDPAVILGLNAPGIFRQLGTTITKVHKDSILCLISIDSTSITGIKTMGYL